MNVVLFCHSLRSCWNHGNAHFLRGMVTELAMRGHRVRVYEPEDAWSVQNLRSEPEGEAALAEVARVYPEIHPIAYRSLAPVQPERRREAPESKAPPLDLDRALDGAHLVIVHEWSDEELVRRIGQKRKTGTFKLLFHDTHHRASTAPHQMGAYDLSHYDGVLAFGDTIRRIYIERGWARRAWTFHEAADVRLFRPIAGAQPTEDVVWIGNWGDDERSAELHQFLIEPVKSLGFTGSVYGVRYPEAAKRALAEAGLSYRGWLPNHRAPRAFAQARLGVHVPRRPYAQALPGIPTIRVFEALACGIPLVSAPWEDTEHLFTPGRDFLVAKNGEQMRAHLRMLKSDPGARAELAQHGLRTILARHTCGHRVDELLRICQALGIQNTAERRLAGGESWG